MEKEIGLIVFDSTNLALKCERNLKSSKIPYTVVPTPMEVSAECGISIIVDGLWVEIVKEQMIQNGCEGYRMIFPFVRKRA